MVLASLGLGLLDQTQLYNDNHAHSTADPASNWSTAPDGLLWTLGTYSNGLAHPTPANPAEHVNWATLAYSQAASEDAISRKICWTIEHYRIAPVALVYGWAHWIVVRGYAANQAPVNAADPAIVIDHFEVNNPWPPVPSATTPALAPPPPHSAGDGCGTGGNRGNADEVVTYHDWYTTYMTGVPSGLWAGQFIALCDPDPPAVRVGRRSPVIRPFPGTAVIPAAAAGQLAVDGMKALGLDARAGRWQDTLRHARPGHAQLVQRLDRADSYYYIVPFETGGELHAAARVEALFGIYLGSILSPHAVGGAAATGTGRLFASPPAAHAELLARPIELGPAGRLVVRPEGLFAYPTLVWKPCLESLSPYYPFRLFFLGGHPIYVRADGRVFTALHDDVRGI
jgi:hypothetical protein